ncbi:MAG: anthranilate synthase component II [Flavobacteriaceae bacterium]
MKKQRILVIDNYDSFVYNIVHYLKELGCTVEVVRNDQFELTVLELYDRIVLSPGPGIPSEAGKLMEAIAYLKTLNHPIPVLGVCLGHQAIAESFGDQLINLSEVYHGLSSTINVDSSQPIYRGLGPQIEVGRYHSWVAAGSKDTGLIISATDEQGTVMSFSHASLPFTGVQYHPESVLTPDGYQLLTNWIHS